MKSIRKQHRFVPLAMAAFAAFAAAPARAASTSDLVPLPSTIDNPCNGDVINVTGHMNLATDETTDATGAMHATIRANVADMQGVSQGGSKYELTGGNTFTVALTKGTELNTTATGQLLTSEGTGKNWDTTTAFHVTVAPDGQTQTTIQSIRAICQ